MSVVCIRVKLILYWYEIAKSLYGYFSVNSAFTLGRIKIGTLGFSVFGLPT